MIFPPPPSLTLLAYAFGSITLEECEELLRLWHEKHDKKDGEQDDEA